MRSFLLSVLVMASLSACASTQAERDTAFHRWVQPDPEDQRVIIDVTVTPHRCYAVSRSANNRGYILAIPVDCETHHEVLQRP
jgi:hypothetical protein